MKLRVWNTKHKIWMNHCALVDCQGKIFSHFIEIDESIKLFKHHLVPLPSEENITQRFAGIKDRDEKDIFEGDIVSVYDKENLFVVKFGTVSRNVQTYDRQSILNLDFNCFYFESLIDGRKYFSITNNHFGERDLKGTVIVGNIFENPELLKN